MLPLVSPRSRRVGIATGALVVLVVLLLSHSFGRAVPTNNYRPLITTDAIESGCYPLPGNAKLDGLAYQVRWDEDAETPTGERRHLYGQYDLVQSAEAQRLLVAAFTKVGFKERGSQELTKNGVRTVDVELARGQERIGISVSELPEVDPDALVRGDFVLDLPVVARAKDDPVCDFPSSTKRWAEEGKKRRGPVR